VKPQRPYLLRALYEWIVDNDETPYVLIKVDGDQVQVPLEHVKDGQIVLNISPSAVRNLVMGDEYVMCSGRFSGREFELVLPLGNVAAIYCKDSGAGMVFPDEEAYASGEVGNPETGQGSTGPREMPSGETSSHEKDEIGERSDAQATDTNASDKPTLRLV